MSDVEERPIATGISTLRRRRGTVKASITRLATRLNELEAKLEESSTLSHLRKLPAKLESLDSEFKVHNYAVIDAIPSDDHADESLEREQVELDQHDARVADLSVRMEELMRPPRLSHRLMKFCLAALLIWKRELV